MRYMSELAVASTGRRPWHRQLAGIRLSFGGRSWGCRGQSPSAANTFQFFPTYFFSWLPWITAGGLRGALVRHQSIYSYTKSNQFSAFECQVCYCWCHWIRFLVDWSACIEPSALRSTLLGEVAGWRGDCSISLQPDPFYFASHFGLYFSRWCGIYVILYCFLWIVQMRGKSTTVWRRGIGRRRGAWRMLGFVGRPALCSNILTHKSPVSTPSAPSNPPFLTFCCVLAARDVGFAVLWIHSSHIFSTASFTMKFTQFIQFWRLAGSASKLDAES